MRLARHAWIVVLWCACALSVWGVERFPPPEFETDYVMKQAATPPPRADWMGWLDVTVLLAALLLASWLILKKRSRRGVFAVMLFSLAYFGFYRQGCVCSIGAIGNVSLSIFQGDYAVGAVVVAFFFLPLFFTLFFGRTFCGGVCPLGAIQDLVLLKPVRVPHWLEAVLRLLAWLYLLLAVLYAATAGAFIICRYDPFVAFFRLQANPAMWMVSIAMLVIAVFVGRPYCRFVCPYGVILRQIARISRFRVTITPDECIQCRLCEDACPFGAIEKPTVEWPQKEYVRGKRRLAWLIACVPLFIAVGGWIGYKLSPSLAMAHPTVALAHRVRAMQDRREPDRAANVSDWTLSALYEDDNAKQRQFAVGSPIVGAVMGLVASLALIQNSIFWKRREYQAHRAGCLACGRCYSYCPRHRQWIKNKQ